MTLVKNDLEFPPMTSFEQVISIPEAREAGFRFGDKGTHTSRTIMLAELSDLLATCSQSATRELYAKAIVEENALGKSTAATRKLSNQRLGELYGLSLSIPVFRVLRRVWEVDEQGRPLVAMLCALARDPLLRATASSVLTLPVGAELPRTSMSAAIRTATGNRFNDSTLDKVARNAASSWSQAGYLTGRVRKIRKEVLPTPGVVAYALWIGALYRFAGEDLFLTSWARALDQSPIELLDLALRAKQLGLINASAGGGIVEIDVSPLDSMKGLI